MYILSPCSHKQPTWPIKLQFPIFLATALKNKLVILTILFLQWYEYTEQGLSKLKNYISHWCLTE